MRRVLSCLSVVLLLAGLSTADAQRPGAEAPAPESNDLSEGWRFRVGGAAGVAPTYEGSDGYEFGGFPDLEINWRDRVVLDGRNGLTLATPRFQGARLGGSVGYSFGRDEDDDDALEGMGDIDGGVRGRLFAEYGLGPYSGSVEVARALDDSNGTTATLSLNARAAMFEGAVMLSGGPSVVWADRNYMESYFGVSSNQAAIARAGYATFAPEAGFKSVGYSGQLLWRIHGGFGALLGVRYDRLLGDAADSPLVDGAGDPDQFGGVLGLSYGF